MPSTSLRTSTSGDAEQDVKKFKEQMKKDAEHLVISIFPEKILSLDILLQDQRFSSNSKAVVKAEINIPIPEKDFVDVNIGTSSSGTPMLVEKSLKRKASTAAEDDDSNGGKPWLFSNGMMPCNQPLIELMEEIKPYMLQLVDDSGKLKLAIHLMVPKIEDGNNFGVEIQQEILDALYKVQDDMACNFVHFHTYFLGRGDLIAKVAKYPQCEDYRHAVWERDEKFRLTLVMILTDLRNHYASLHDLVVKNLNKIKEPKSQNNFDAMF